PRFGGEGLGVRGCCLCLMPNPLTPSPSPPKRGRGEHEPDSLTGLVYEEARLPAQARLFGQAVLRPSRPTPRPRPMGWGMAEKATPPAEPTVTFWGAARTVTGSMHMVEACGQTLLLDCGLFQGSRAETYHRNCEFPFRPKDIDAVLLSHAHIDHCGNL